MKNFWEQEHSISTDVFNMMHQRGMYETPPAEEKKNSWKQNRNFPKSVKIKTTRKDYKKESCLARILACGGSLQRQLPLRRSAIRTKRFLFHRNAVSYEIRKNGSSLKNQPV